MVQVLRGDFGRDEEIIAQAIQIGRYLRLCSVNLGCVNEGCAEFMGSTEHTAAAAVLPGSKANFGHLSGAASELYVFHSPFPEDGNPC